MKVKQWIKDHKKEIIVGAVAAGGTALYFMVKEKEEECFGWRSKSNLHTNINLK